MKQWVKIEGSTLDPENYILEYEEKPETPEEHNAMRSVLYDEQTEEKREDMVSGIAYKDRGSIDNIMTEVLIALYQDKSPNWFEIMKWFYYKTTPQIEEEDAEEIVKETLKELLKGEEK